MAYRHRTCAHCGRQFSYEVARGKDRRYCDAVCARAALELRQEAASGKWPTCAVDGCGKRVRSAGCPYCEAHYTRQRRHGRLTRYVPPHTISHSQGYVLEYAPDHWLAKRGGSVRVYQHRRVYFDAHGEGPFRCRWCDREVTWDTMDVDHVNAVRDDNREENLVASCPSCNVSRAAPNIRAASIKAMAKMLTLDGVTRPLGDWAADLGISRVSMQWRLDAGWSLRRALTEARGKTGPMARHP